MRDVDDGARAPRDGATETMKTMNNNLPAYWDGGRLEGFPGELEPLDPVWYDQGKHQHPDDLGLVVDGDQAVASLAESDPPEPWGELDRGEGGRGRDRETEVVIAKVAQASANYGGGLLLIGHEGWFARSRYGAVGEE